MANKTEALTLRSEEASKLLGVCTKTLWTLTKNGVIPCLKIGKSVRYSKEKLIEYVNQGWEATKT